MFSNTFSRTKIYHFTLCYLLQVICLPSTRWRWVGRTSSTALCVTMPRTAAVACGTMRTVTSAFETSAARSVTKGSWRGRLSSNMSAACTRLKHYTAHTAHMSRARGATWQNTQGWCIRTAMCDRTSACIVITAVQSVETVGNIARASIVECLWSGSRFATSIRSAVMV